MASGKSAIYNLKMEADSSKELARRVSARMEEAKIGVSALATRAAVDAGDLDGFLRGEKVLGAGALMRLARGLGVPEGSFLHVHMPEVRAMRDPSIMLSAVAQEAALASSDRDALAAALHRARAFAELGRLLQPTCLADEFQAKPARKNKPYLAGYDLARKVRSALEFKGQPLRDLRRLIEDRFNILVVAHAFTDARIQAAACRSGDARLIAIRPGIRFESSRRSILAHELGHQLADLHEEGVVTDEQAEEANGFSAEPSASEKRARAFAIMLLAPRSAIKGILGDRRFAEDEARAAISQCRQIFGVGFTAMAWHLFHLDYFNFHEDRVARLVETDDGLDVSGFETAGDRDGLERRVEEALQRDAISAGRARIFLAMGSPAAAA